MLLRCIVVDVLETMSGGAAEPGHLYFPLLRFASALEDPLRILRLKFPAVILCSGPSGGKMPGLGL